MTFTGGWGAVTTLVGTLGAVLLTQLFARKGERDRAKATAAEKETDREHERRLREADRAHERELREIELRDAHRGRLYADRKAAYADFYRRYLVYRRAESDATLAWARRQYVVGNRDHVQPGDYDEAQQMWTDALDRATEAARSIEEALMLVELVASPSVRDAAADLRDLAKEARDAANEHAGSDMDDPSSLDLFTAYLDAERAVTAGEECLRRAIQAELGLGR